METAAIAKIRAFGVCAIALIAMVFSLAFVGSAQAESIKKQKLIQPTSVHLNKKAQFLGHLKYNNQYIFELGLFKLAANVPVEAELNVEIPTLMQRPKVTSHTHNFTTKLLSKKKTVIGREAWSTYSRIWIASPTEIRIGLKAKAVTKGKGSETYIGTRPLTKESNVNTEYNSFKSFKVVK